MNFKRITISAPPELKKIIEKDVFLQKRTRNVTTSSLIAEILYQHYKNVGKIK